MHAPIAQPSRPGRRPALPARRMLALALGAAACAGAHAGDDYPSHAITIVSPFAAGGTGDIVARLTAKALYAELKQSVIVENRAGAGGVVGASFVAKSRPDGYTLIMHTTSSAVLNGLLHKNLPYDAKNDFIPVGLIGTQPEILLTSGATPAADIKSFIALAKKNGPLNFGSSGVGGIMHLSSVHFATAAGIDAVHIPYRGESEAINSLISGQTQFQSGSLVSTMPLIKQGALRVLCIMSTKRSDMIPDTPTCPEAGLPSLLSTNWHALFAPKGTPADVVAKLSDAVARVTRNAGFSDQITKLGFSVQTMSSDQLATYRDEEIERWKAVVQAARLEAQ
ncbi:tripartite tricarboxylate transporter substrate binding protein [Pigmentiphaga soli]|uniref:Tripartite tricarboxylate transporter substrate binding protein n=2 Tax=Pigmentiphaga soli TaxID=1007095 RepID=A0ABP8GLT6_9BURK